jgi:cyclophilin family peptidyl-prolyl cis-trans isomerase
LQYVDANLFEDSTFYGFVTMGNQPDNDIKIQVVQGGLGYTEGRESRPPIEHETTDKTGILHKDGVISMARLEPGRACSEFFICVGDQPELDFGGRRNPKVQGFAAFGRVAAEWKCPENTSTARKRPDARSQNIDIRYRQSQIEDMTRRVFVFRRFRTLAKGILEGKAI